MKKNFIADAEMMQAAFIDFANRGRAAGVSGMVKKPEIEVTEEMADTRPLHRVPTRDGA